MAVKKREPDTFSFQPFEGLKEIIRTRGIEFNTAPPVRKKPEPPTDDELFNRAMTGVREIKEFRAIRPKAKRAAAPLIRKGPDRDTVQALEELVAGLGALNLTDTQEYVQWINEDCRADLARLLHEGRFSVKDCIDLHGFTVEEAEKEVTLFLGESLRKGHKCLKIIHGRGLRSPRGPVVKEMLVRRLARNYRKHVVAFVTARQCDGGLGALYVLLK